MATANLTRPNRVVTYLRFLKIEHSLFALPFVLIGGLIGFDVAGRNALAADAWPIWGLIVLAAVTARTAAMALNRIIDRSIDARNPRTAGREMPRGVVQAAEAWAMVAVSFALLFWAAWSLNPLCLALAPVLVVLFTVYPYTKRWSAGAHFVLGAALACGPAGGFLAVTGSFTGSAAVGVLALAVAFWVAGFDILYALLDVEFDRTNGIKSIPAAIGVQNSLTLSRYMHLGVVGLFLVVGYLADLAWPYWLAWLVVLGLLHYEHAQAQTLEPGAINRAFFQVNAIVGWVMFAGVAGALLP